MQDDNETPTIYENEAAQDFKSRVASRLTGVRKTLTSIAKKKTSVVGDLDDSSSSPSRFRKSSFKPSSSSAATKDAVEKSCIALLSNPTAAEEAVQEHLRTLTNVKGTLRPYLLAQLQQHSMFAFPFTQYLDDSKHRLLVLAIVLELTSSPHDLQFAGEVYVAMKASEQFYVKFLEHSGEESALQALVNIAKVGSTRAPLLGDFKDLWNIALLRWLRYPAYASQQTLALHLLQLLSVEEANRVSMYADLKPGEKTVMDLITAHNNNDNANTARLAMLLLSNLAAHRYNAMYMATTLKPVWPALQTMLANKDTPKDTVNAALELMCNLSAVRDANEVFAYSDIKPILSTLMDLCRSNSKTSAVHSVLALWNNLAQIHDNRVAMHNDLKSMWPTFLQFLAKSSTADTLVLQTLSLLNNLAFAVENQQDMLTLIRPHWPAFMGHINKPRTLEIQSMSVLLLRNLAVAAENKPVVFRDMDPVWPTLLEALRNSNNTDLQTTSATEEEMEYGVCHLLWNLSKCDANRAKLYMLLAPMLNAVFARIEQRKTKENVYALLALLKNLAQSNENRKVMAVDLLPHFPVLLQMFDMPENDSVIDDLEVTVWLFQNLASERDNQISLYIALKPVTPKLCNMLLTTNSEDLAEQILALWSSLAMGKTHASWVYVDLEPVRSKLREMLQQQNKNRDLVMRVLQLYANMAGDGSTAVWLYAELSQQLELVCQYAASDEHGALQEHAIRLLSLFATRELREEIISANIVELFQANEESLDCVLALAVLTGGDEARVADWFADDSKVLIVLKVLEDCTVTCEWGYELERPLEALSYLVQVDAMRARVKVNMVLDSVEVAWKRRDMVALKYAYAVLTQCVGDENNEIRFMGSVSLMETARTLAKQQDCAAQQQAKQFLEKFPDMGHYA